MRGGRLSNHAAPLMGRAYKKKSCKPNAASLLIAEAQPIFMGEAHNERATRRSGYIPSGGKATGRRAKLGNGGVGRGSSFGTFLQRKVVKVISSAKKGI